MDGSMKVLYFSGVYFEKLFNWTSVSSLGRQGAAPSQQNSTMVIGFFFFFTNEKKAWTLK